MISLLISFSFSKITLFLFALGGFRARCVGLENELQPQGSAESQSWGLFQFPWGQMSLSWAGQKGWSHMPGSPGKSQMSLCSCFPEIFVKQRINLLGVSFRGKFRTEISLSSSQTEGDTLLTGFYSM